MKFGIKSLLATLLGVFILATIIMHMGATKTLNTLYNWQTLTGALIALAAAAWAISSQVAAAEERRVRAGVGTASGSC